MAQGNEWVAKKVEITTLTKLKSWKVIPITSEMNILDSNGLLNASDTQMEIFENLR